MAEEDKDALARSLALGESEKCLRRMDALLHCYSPPHQLGCYYTFGTIDPCHDALDNLMSCFKLKTARYTVEEKEKMIDKMNQANEFSPSSAIWKFRQNPRTDWAQSGQRGKDEAQKQL